MQELPPQLKLMTEQGKIPHALLFTGPKGSGKSACAIAFAKQILCQRTPNAAHKIDSNNHPDIHHYHPEGKSGTHSIESLRKLSYETALCANEGSHKFFIIHQAEAMSPTSGNALLKTFEEPSKNTIIILLSSHPEKILSTILSRCQTVPFQGSVSPSLHEGIESLFNLPRPVPFHLVAEKIAELSSTHEKEKKQWEKELRQKLPKELTPIQKEAHYKEIEGTIALRSFEKHQSQLTTILQTLIKQTPPSRHHVVEKAINEANTALQRSMKLSTTLEALFLKLENYLPDTK